MGAIILRGEFSGIPRSSQDTETRWCGVSSTGREGVAGAKTASAPCGGLEKGDVGCRVRHCQTAGGRENRRNDHHLPMNLKPIGKSRPSLKIGVAALLLFAALLVSLKFGPQTLESEITFDTDLHNSLWNLDRAKQQWALEHLKSERDIPTLTELAPYLGEWNERIGKLSALGISVARE